MNDPLANAGVHILLVLVLGGLGEAAQFAVRHADPVPRAMSDAALREEMRLAASLGFAEVSRNALVGQSWGHEQQYALPGGRCIAVIVVDIGSPAQPTLALSSDDTRLPRSKSAPDSWFDLVASYDRDARSLTAHAQWCAPAGPDVPLRIDTMPLPRARAVPEELHEVVVILEASRSDVTRHGGVRRGYVTRAGVWLAGR